MTNLLARKTTFVERFRSRQRLRFHMSLILAATVGSGLLATWIMLALGLKNVMIRYPLAVVAAYLAFLLCIKLWLKLVFSFSKQSSSGSFNILGSGSSGSSSGGSSGTGDFKGGGGGFGGGGASGSFEAKAIVAQGSAEVLSTGADTAAGAAEGTGSVAKGAASGLDLDLDLDKGWIAVLVVAVIVAVVLGAGIYLIYQAPLILSDAAFEFILAGGLARRARRLASGDWVGSVFKATWIPLALTLLLTVLAAVIMHIFFPGVTRISELLAHI